jgi:hypothetical protein
VFRMMDGSEVDNILCEPPTLASGKPAPLRAKSPKISDIRAPPFSDPRWKEWSVPIQELLSSPRTWVELEAWRKETKTNGSLLRHCLAWLEEMGLARTRYVKINGKSVISWESNLRDPASLP